MSSLRKKALAIIRHFRFFHHIPSQLSIVCAFIATGNYNLTQLFSIVLSLLLTDCFVSSVNNSYDIETDQSSQLMRTQNPIVTGELSLKAAKVMNLVLPILSIAVGVFAGPYWIGLPLIAIILVVLYDIRPFRAKDRPVGSIILPLSQCLPFLFGYAAATSGFAFPPWTVCVFAFLYLNGTVLTRHLPDMEIDLRLGIRNFSTVYGAEATRRVDMISTILAGAMLMVGILLGGLSLIGVPLLAISVATQVRTLSQGTEALKKPEVFRKFVSGSIPNSVSMALSVVLRGLI